MKLTLEPTSKMTALPCDECKGRCCTYPSMTETEFQTIKAVYGLPEGAIVRNIIRVEDYDVNLNGMGALTVHLADGTCPYLRDGKCSVYSLRPKVCRDYGKVKDLPCEYVYPKEAKARHDERVRRAKERGAII
jgi:Fe-S-cluster containining protein